MSDFDLKDFMHKHKLTDNMVSDITGSSVRTVKSWLNGERNMKDASIKLLKKEVLKGGTKVDISFQDKVNDLIFQEIAGIKASIKKTLAGDEMNDLIERVKRL